MFSMNTGGMVVIAMRYSSMHQRRFKRKTTCFGTEEKERRISDMSQLAQPAHDS